ncbi:MAG: hypothetical protein AB4911_13060 [Oscillochloridaceae bacterium umkhey_bin13]
MQSMLDAPLTTTLFHCRTGGFPLARCSYALLDADGNATNEHDRVAIVRVTAISGERFRLRDRAEIQRFLRAIGRPSTGEVAS